MTVMADVSVPEIIEEMRYRTGQRRKVQERTRKEKRLNFMVFALRVSLLCIFMMVKGQVENQSQDLE